jgi:CRP-like cAMP-binding protein
MVERDRRFLDDALAGAELFSDLSPSARRELTPHFRALHHPPQAILFHEGQPATAYHLIGSGKVKVTQTSLDGEEVILHVAERGDIIGALPTPGESTYPASAQALEESVTFSIGSDEFDAILLRHPVVARRLLGFATRQLQLAHRRVREMATERVERRIARTLTRLASQLGKKRGSDVDIDAPLSRQDLAELSGTTLYTVSRTLKEWQRAGLVQARRKRITILDPHGLVTIAEDLPPTASSG